MVYLVLRQTDHVLSKALELDLRREEDFCDQIPPALGQVV
jgi:hypothetical protein